LLAENKITTTTEVTPTTTTWQETTTSGCCERLLECMKTVDEEIAEIKAEFLIVQQNFTNVEDVIETMKNYILQNFTVIEEKIGLVEENIDNMQIDINNNICSINTMKNDILDNTFNINEMKNDVSENTCVINDTVNKPRFAAEIRTLSSPFYLPVGDVKGYNEFVDIGDNFNPETGIFTVGDNEEEGIYMFLYDGKKGEIYQKEGQLKVLHNNATVQYNDETDSTHRSEINGIVV